MAIGLATAFQLVLLCTGVVLSAMGYHTYRTWDQPGTVPFVAFVSITGIGLVGIAVASLAAPTFDIGGHIWSPLGISLWALTMIPWITFVLQYTGTYTRITRRTIVALTLPAAAFPLLFTSIWFGERTIFSMLGSLSALYLIGLLTIGCYLVVRTSYRYGHLTLRQGVVLSLAPVTHFIIANFSGPIIESLGEGPAVGMFTLGMVGCTAAVGASLYRYETFQSTPAVGRIGERVIVRQTEDLMFVVDEEERVIRLNRTAADRLDVSKTGALGEELSEVIGASIDDVEGMETIELLTDEGSRQFDPVISRLTDQHDRELGHTLSLHDVTELELREQRLEVLNRVLRHNLRNQIEVIKSNAEVLADGTADGYAHSIIKSADRLTELGRSARSIDQIVSQPSTTGDVDVAALVREIAENARTQNGVELSLSVPEEAMVVTERHALVAATESAIKNALSRADTEVRATLERIEPGYCLTVVDDGPGIPDEEIETISAGTETPLQHATGLGLWRLKWAVTKFNGELSIDNDGRTTVELRVPDQDR